MARPPLGKPSVGDKVIVREGGRRGGEIDATIVKVGRKWLTVESSYGRRWRFSIETQRDDRGVGYGTRFVTPEQKAYYEALAEARKYVREVHGLDLRYGSPWAVREIELAEILRTHGRADA